MSVATYISACATWLRNGKPGLTPPAPEHDVLIGDCMREIEQVEQAWLKDSGVPAEWSSWRTWDPAYMTPMKEARRRAVEAGENPDSAARAFTAAFIAKQEVTDGIRK